MSTPTPYQESFSVTLPEPCPTQPVAGRPVETDAPVFDWTAVPDATRYRVQIASTEAFDTVHFDERRERGAAVALDSVLPEEGSTAYWRVRAEGEEGNVSEWSAPAHFAGPAAGGEATEAALRVEAPPVPLHPEASRDTPVDPSAVPFSWEGIPEASGYQLQVASTEDFEEPVVELTVDQTTSVTLYEVLSTETGSYYWRLRPLFRVADPGPWSRHVSFAVTSSEAEQDLAPEAADPQASARAAGPVEQGQTSGTITLVVSLIAVLSFVVTIGLIFLVG